MLAVAFLLGGTIGIGTLAFALGFGTGRLEDGTIDFFGKGAAWLNGGSPTEGVLTYATKGPLAGFFQGLAYPGYNQAVARGHDLDHRLIAIFYQQHIARGDDPLQVPLFVHDEGRVGRVLQHRKEFALKHRTPALIISPPFLRAAILAKIVARAKTQVIS